MSATRISGLLIAVWVVFVVTAAAQPGGGIDIPTPDLVVSMDTDGVVLIRNLGDSAAPVGAFNLHLTCTGAGRAKCGAPLQNGSLDKAITNWKTGSPAPIKLPGPYGQFLLLTYPGSAVLYLPIAKWGSGDFTFTTKVDSANAVAEKNEANNTADAVVSVKQRAQIKPASKVTQPSRTRS